MPRRLISTILVAIVAACLFAQPAAEATGGDDAVTQVRVAALKGPTAMGLVQLMDRSEDGAVKANAYTC